MNNEKCLECGKAVYASEKLAADEKIYHKSCFRCKKCNNVLKLGSYASMQGEVFCKPCFKKNFFSKGNYSEGFGKLKPQQEHDLKSGKITDGFGLPASESSPKEPETTSGPSKGSFIQSARAGSPVKENNDSPKKVSFGIDDKPKPKRSSLDETSSPSKEKVSFNDKAQSYNQLDSKASIPAASKELKERSPSGSPSNSKCISCSKAVFKMEELIADEKVYHKTCFRCKKCNNILKLGSYASMEGDVFCKNCFKKNFFSKGNYSEGFGKLKPQQEHDLKTGKTTEEELRKNFDDVAEEKNGHESEDKNQEEESQKVSQSTGSRFGFRVSVRGYDGIQRLETWQRFIVLGIRNSHLVLFKRKIIEYDATIVSDIIGGEKQPESDDSAGDGSSRKNQSHPAGSRAGPTLGPIGIQNRK